MPSHHGTIATLPELIHLKTLVQSNACRAQSTALKMGHRSTHLRGRGMDFAEVRNYQAGDEIRHMEWRATARTGRPHIKLYEEERERPVILLTDFNPSMHFGTQHLFKSVLAARLAALLAWLASAEGDRVGGFLFSGTAYKAYPPKSRQKGVLPLLHGLSHYTQTLHNTPDVTARPLEDVLQQLQQVLKPGSLLILISDFYGLNDAAMPLLTRFKRHNDFVAYHIADTLERNPPKPGLYPISNGQQTGYLDLRKPAAQSAYYDALNARNTHIQSFFNRLNAAYFPLTAQSDWVSLAHQSFPRSQHG